MKDEADRLNVYLMCDEHAVNINCGCYFSKPVGNRIQSRGTWVPFY